MKRVITMGGLILLMVAFGVVASADTIDFAVPGTQPLTAKIWYSGGNTALQGSGIAVSTLSGLGTLLNNGVAANCAGCLLSFQTGIRTSATSVPISTWNFGGGAPSWIQIVGTFNGYTGTLLSGTFASASVQAAGNVFKVAIASFVNTVNPAVSSFFGLQSGPYAGNFNIGFTATANAPGSFQSTGIRGAPGVQSGNLTTNPVPEPISIVLLGTVLLGCTVLARRKRTV